MSHPRHVRPLRASDLSDIRRIERESYVPELRESDAAMRSKMALFPAGALGCFDGAEMSGYCFALPWRGLTPIGVAEVLEGLPADPDVMYIHDMVVSAARRRQGVASALLAEIVRLAGERQLDRLTLVAVQGSEPFWARAGFSAAATLEYVTGVRGTIMTRGGVPPAAG